MKFLTSVQNWNDKRFQGFSFGLLGENPIMQNTQD
jgi:hypothetical protein